MWTEERRRIYRREGESYPSDLRDAEWVRLAPLIPPARPGGRPRKTDMRAAMNAILYLLHRSHVLNIKGRSYRLRDLEEALKLARS